MSLISGGKEFTAVFCTNDMMAYGCISELCKAGLKVPEDVSVIGVDDIICSADFNPPLTTIAFDKQFQGQRAFEILYNSIKNDEVINETIPTKLVIRESCCPAKNG